MRKGVRKEVRKEERKEGRKEGVSKKSMGQKRLKNYIEKYEVDILREIV